MGSLLLSPGSWCTQGSVYALQESVSPVLCKFWRLYGGVNGDLPQGGICHTQVYCTQSPCPCSNPLLTCTSTGDTHSSVSVTMGSLGPGTHKVLFVSSKSLFPQSYVSSGSSVVGLMVTSSKRAYAISRYTAPEPLTLQQSTADLCLHLRPSNTVLAQSLWVFCVWCTQGLLQSSECR